jgi:peptidoglycan/xylan/chitin deacetylase (PgdA/CDA1 family)
MWQRMRSRWLERSGRLCDGIVLLFHEIESDDGYRREFKRGCTLGFLQSVIVQLGRDGWEFVSLDEAVRRLAGNGPSRRFVAITFDDGYRNTLTHAFPLLERHGIPFTVYVPTGAPTRELNSWWLGLRALFRQRDTVTISGMEQTFECRDADSKLAAHNRVNAWVHEDYRRAALLHETFRAYDISLADLNGSYFMDEAELRSLLRSPLATTGAHTTSHAALSNLDAEEARLEITGNRAYLERLVDRAVLHFAYPYGSAYGPREIRLASTVGFRTAVTNRAGAIFAANTNPYEIPRLAASGASSALPYFAAKLRQLSNASIDDSFSL